MKLHDVMSQNVEMVEAQATLAEAAKIMKRANVGILPVIGPTSKPVGVITDRDIALRSLADGLSPNSQVRLAMSQNLYMLQEEEEIDVALDLMRDKQISRILVSDRYGSLVGLLSIHDAAIACDGNKSTTRVDRALKERVVSGTLSAPNVI